MRRRTATRGREVRFNYLRLALHKRKKLELWLFHGMIMVTIKKAVGTHIRGDRSTMVTEAEDGKWLLEKARQLKERALGTADITRRKQFLLIATEYQKLARLPGPNQIAIGIDQLTGRTNVAR